MNCISETITISWQPPQIPAQWQNKLPSEQNIVQHLDTVTAAPSDNQQWDTLLLSVEQEVELDFSVSDDLRRELKELREAEEMEEGSGEMEEGSGEEMR